MIYQLRRVTMKRIALALLFAAAPALAASDTYEVAFNAQGYSFIQTATMSGYDTATAWFITPIEAAHPHYLIQVASGSDSRQVQHHAVMTTTDGLQVGEAWGYAPSFYVTIGPNGLLPATAYLLTITNENIRGVATCKPHMTCNVTVLVQPAN